MEIDFKWNGINLTWKLQEDLHAEILSELNSIPEHIKDAIYYMVHHNIKNLSIENPNDRSNNDRIIFVKTCQNGH